MPSASTETDEKELGAQKTASGRREKSSANNVSMSPDERPSDKTMRRSISSGHSHGVQTTRSIQTKDPAAPIAPSSEGGIVVSVVILIVIAATIAGFMGYKGREQVVGVDLGTTFSVVAFKSNAGDVRIIPDYISKKSLTPSVVHYKADGSNIVGDLAVPFRETHPKDTIYNAKRFIGKMFDEVEYEIKNHRYNVVDVAGNATFALESSDKKIQGVDVGSDVLKHLYKSIESARGYPMSTAVICIPAKFGVPEAAATKLAFEKAGFKVLRVIDEPTAAAVAYNLHKHITPRNILVYDFGGGTLDASLLWMNGDAATMIGTQGDDHLGGSDFDHVVQKYLKPKLPECTSAELGLKSEQAKIDLSEALATKITCGEAHITFTREEFEDITKELFERAFIPVGAILKEAMMETNHVSDVVMVGGATRMPRIRTLMREYFPEETAVHTHIDPDTTIAVGAANIY